MNNIKLIVFYHKNNFNIFVKLYINLLTIISLILVDMFCWSKVIKIDSSWR